LKFGEQTIFASRQTTPGSGLPVPEAVVIPSGKLGSALRN